MIGLSEALGKIAALPERARDNARLAALDAAGEAAALARAAAPVQTGALRASIHARADGDAAAIETNCPYAGAVELGTRFCPARPFLVPGALGADYFARTVRALGEAMK